MDGEHSNIVDNANEMRLYFSAISENEAFARTAVAAFITKLNPTVQEITEIKTAVSEAVTNAIVHGYEGRGHDKRVQLYCRITGRELYIEVTDEGIGIPDIKLAMEPTYTSKPEQERGGMGFAFMDAFMDELNVTSVPGGGVTVAMTKTLGDGS
ncbi:MAG: anti-sigma F factor [Clostridiales bacterium]|jgi:stage II sporulation protein AB (anti-sigma F factor)|nr:anti-sigma F factor [Clostridiales bacterium]